MLETEVCFLKLSGIFFFPQIYLIHTGDIRNAVLIPGSRRSSGGRHSNPLQYSCLENPMDRGACWATIQGITKSRTRLSNAQTHRERWETCHPRSRSDVRLDSTHSSLCRCSQGNNFLSAELLCLFHGVSGFSRDMEPLRNHWKGPNN